MRPWAHRRNSIEPADSWFVQLDGKPYAVLDDPQDRDMFWFSWRFKQIEGTNCPDDLWDGAYDTRRAFLHCDTGEVVTNVIPAGPNSGYADGRVVLRGPHKTGPGRIQRVI